MVLVGRKAVERYTQTFDIMQPAFERMHHQRDKRNFADRFPVIGAGAMHKFSVDCNRFLIASRIPAA